MLALWSLRYPSHEQLQMFVASQAKCDFSYTHIGVTAGDSARPGFDHDQNRVLLGSGDRVFQQACQALRQWRQFPEPWTKIFPPDAPLEVGQTVAVATRVLGSWRLNSARIVFIFDEHQPIRRFGFAYGTLPAHIEFGEERFTIEQHQDGSVWYDITAFSKPRLWLVRVGYPIARFFQRRFVRDSKSAMVASVAAPA